MWDIVKKITDKEQSRLPTKTDPPAPSPPKKVTPVPPVPSKVEEVPKKVPEASVGRLITLGT